VYCIELCRLPAISFRQNKRLFPNEHRGSHRKESRAERTSKTLWGLKAYADTREVFNTTKVRLIKRNRLNNTPGGELYSILGPIVARK